MKKIPQIAAAAFIDREFPDCEAALLAGSVVRGEATPTSDLDLFVLIPSLPSAYRESFVDGEWMIEAFVHNADSARQYFESDCRRGRPSLPRMVAEGVVLRNSPALFALQEEAKIMLAHGPQPWDASDIDSKRYFITDTLLDFIGSDLRREQLFIAGKLAELLHEFILRTNRRWTGSGKWVWKAINAYSPELAEEFFAVFDNFYRDNGKQSIVAFTDAVLKPYGGRLFGGYAAGKVVK